MIAHARVLAHELGVSATSRATGLPRSSLYRWQTGPPSAKRPPRPPSPRALSSAEADMVLALLTSEPFCDLAPRQVYARLLDDGRYLCSWRTMYRLLATHALIHERRRQRRHGAYAKPELLATRPNELWSWDITRLKGPRPGTYFYLYVIVDVFSRYVPGYLVADQESAELARTLIDTTLQRQGIGPDQLVLHADRGAPMTAGVVADLLTALGVRQSHSRPHLANDNPYSEAQFKTVKYHPAFPARFEHLAHARDWAQHFFPWYNHAHHHTALALMRPADVHYQQADTIRAQRQRVLHLAFDDHPERFVQGRPRHPHVPDQVWINPPTPTPEKEPGTLQ